MTLTEPAGLQPGTDEYDPGDGWDEAFEAPGVLRPHYADVIEALAEVGPARAAQDVMARLCEEGVTFGGDDAPVTTVGRDEPKIGRNDPCYCGSGKKYKKCHGA